MANSALVRVPCQCHPCHMFILCYIHVVTSAGAGGQVPLPSAVINMIASTTIVGVSSSMSELESLSSRAAELSSKADFWNTAVLWALAITALAAVAIVVSQAAGVR